MYPPGWYQDAVVPGQERWWDGTTFTAHIRPPGAPPFAPPVKTHSWGNDLMRSTVSARQRDIRVDLASGKNAHATVALVSSLLSLLGWPIACVAGFVFGILGLRRAGQYAAAGHPPRGRVMSVWALVLSVVGTAVTVVAILVKQSSFL